MHYDLTDLKVLLAVMEEGNLSRGASRCNLAPSSVSARIRELEEAFGTPLLKRKQRGVEATAAGSVMAEHARRCIAQLEQMHADLFPFSQGITGRVTVFANNNAITSFIPDDLAVFFKAHPSVRITLEERNSNHIVAAVADNRADVGVVALDVDHPKLRFHPYRRDELVLLAPPAHRLGRRKKVRFNECLAYPFVSLLEGAVIHTYLANHAIALGGRLDVRVQVAGYGAVARLVASGAGLGVVPRSVLRLHKPVNVAVIGLDEPWAVRNLRVCVRRDAEPNLYRDRLVETLCAAAGG